MDRVNNKSGLKREEWIDILRALAMYLVVVGHMYNNNTFYQVVNPIKMPLFYFLSGFFISLNKDFVTFVKGVLYRLILPWLVLSMFPFWVAQNALSGGKEKAILYIKDFLLGYDLWFVPSFIITQILCYLIYHLVKKNEIATLVVSGVCFLVGILLKDVAFFDIWAMNTALTGVLFVVMGKLFFMHKDVIMERCASKVSVYIVALAVYVALVVISIVFFPGQTMNFHDTEYFNLPICLLLILAGFECCLFIAPKLGPNVVTKYISIMGQNTLVVYLANGFVRMVLFKVVKRFGLLGDTPSLIESLFWCAVVCAICTVISVVCGKIYPPLIGKKKVK